MNIRKFASAAIIAVAGLFATVAVAQAQSYQAAATTSLNVRSGPGTGFGVVGVLATNQIVNVLECNAANTWCRVQDRTLTGWASARYLAPIGPGGTPPRPGQPDVNFSISTPGFSFSIGTGTPPSARGRVCFFEERNYRGRNFCANPGDSARFMDRFWDDRIRSIRVEGPVSATVCTQQNFRGRCTVINRSLGNLGFMADNISSFRVERAR